MTPQEARIADSSPRAAPNRAVAADLFISSATVDYHLRKVYQKLGVKSRAQLAASIGDLGGLPTGGPARP